jgi:hypothetical protein
MEFTTLSGKSCILAFANKYDSQANDEFLIMSWVVLTQKFGHNVEMTVAVHKFGGLISTGFQASDVWCTMS